jgi:Spy/CpxP family protein refolding chaperone
MKNVVKVFVAVAVMSVFTVSAFAQGAGPAKGGVQGGKAGGPGGPGGMRRGGGMMGMDDAVLAKLNLTADQKKKVASLKEATKKKGEEFRKSLGLGAGAGKAGAGKAGAGGPGGQRVKLTDEQRNKLKAIGEGYQSGLKKILTPTQQATYEKEMKAQREKMRSQFQKGGAAGGPGGAAGKGKGKNIPPQS